MLFTGQSRNRITMIVEAQDTSARFGLLAWTLRLQEYHVLDNCFIPTQFDFYKKMSFRLKWNSKQLSEAKWWDMVPLGEGEIGLTTIFSNWIGHMPKSGRGILYKKEGNDRHFQKTEEMKWHGSRHTFLYEWDFCSKRFQLYSIP